MVANFYEFDDESALSHWQLGLGADLLAYYFCKIIVFIQIKLYDSYKLQLFSPLKSRPFLTIDYELAFRSASIQSTTDELKKVPVLHFLFLVLFHLVVRHNLEVDLLHCKFELRLAELYTSYSATMDDGEK